MLPVETLPEAVPSAHGARCEGETKRGGPCPNAADGDGPFCLLHDPARVEERRQAMSARGKAGRAKQQKRTAMVNARLMASVALGSSTMILAALEHALAEVQTSGAEAIEKANATARLCTVAMTVLRQVDIEKDATEQQKAFLALTRRGNDD